MSLPSSTTLAKSTIDVSVSLVEGDAYIYCAAFTTSTSSVTPPTLSEVVRNGYMFKSSSSVATTTISSLIPVTSYNVYCVTQSSYGTLLSEEKMLATKQTIETACCKALYFDLTTSTLKESLISLNALSLSIESAPSSDLVIEIGSTATTDCTNVEGCTNNVFYPGAISLSTDKFKSSYSMTLVTGTPDLYDLNITLSGAAAEEYEVSFSKKGDQLNVISEDAEPPAPTLLSSTFSDDGSYVTVLFDSSTNKGKYTNSFICTSLLNFNGASAAKCTWTDSTKVTISGITALAVGDTIQVLPEKIKAKCTSSAADCDTNWDYMSSSTVTVAAPASPKIPVVSIGAPATIGGCNSLTLDLSASTGNGGRPWQSISFSIDSKAENASMIADYLNNNYVLSPPTVIPNTYFARGGAYGFSVTMCNFLGACGSNTYKLSISSNDDPVPVVKIAGKSSITITHDSSYLSLVASAYTENCDGSLSTSNLGYSWSVVGHSSDDYKQVSKDPSKFKLSTSKLTVYNTYTVKLTVTHSSGKSSSASVSVYVDAASLVVAISGGSTQSVRIEDSIVLSAADSYDPDQPGLLGKAAGISFTWSCVQISPTYSASCPLSSGISTDETFELSVNSESLLDVAVLVTVTGTSGSRVVEASATVVVIDAADPIVSITTSSNELTSVNVDNSLVISGTVALAQSCEATWTTDDESLDLSSIALTGTFSQLTPGALRTVNLVLSANSLAETASYVFYLSCGASTSSVAVTTNGPPTPGLFSVSPSAGTELSDSFLFAASQWSDQELPLSYVFGFHSPSDYSLILSIRSLSEIAFASSTLPAGLATNGYTIVCVTKVYDSYDAYTTATFNVTVQAISSDTDALLQEQLSNSVGSTDSVKQVLSLSSAILNRSNCTTNCTSKVALRDSLLTSLSDLTASEDVSSLTVAAWTDNLAALTSNSAELSEDSVVAVQNVAAMVLSGSSSEGISYETSAGILSALSNAATVSSDNTGIADLVSSYGDLVSSQLYAGESPVTSILDSFRVTAAAISPSDGTAVIDTPLTSDEIANGMKSSSISLETDTSSTSSVKVSAVTMQPSFGSFNSPALKLSISGMEALTSSASNRRLSTPGAYVTIVLQNNEAINTTIVPSPYSLFTQCNKYDLHVDKYTCPDTGYEITHSCPGDEATYNMTSSCPGLGLAGMCAELDMSSQTTSESTCTLLSYTDTDTTCSCFVAVTSRRRLGSNAEEQSGASTIVAMSSFVADQFAGTISSAGSMDSLQDFQKVLIVIIMFSTLWAGGLILLSGCLFQQTVDSKSINMQQLAHERKKRMAAMQKSPIAIKEYLTNYVSSVIPSVFSTSSLFKRFGDELCTNHSYFSLLYSNNKLSREKKMLLCIQLLTVQTMLMFLLAVFYDLQAPDDDGSCATFLTSDTCVARKSMFDKSQSYCSWSEVTASCAYQTPSFSMLVVIYVGVLTSIVTSIVNYPIDRIFDILGSPTAVATVTSKVGSEVSILNKVSANVSEKKQVDMSWSRVKKMLATERKDIPESTRVAYDLALSSIDIVASNVQEQQHKANVSRHEKRLTMKGDDASDSSDDEELSSPTREATVTVISRPRRGNNPPTKTKMAPSKDSNADITVRGLFDLLKNDIHFQRKLLRPNEIEEYDAQWGIDPTGAFATTSTWVNRSRADIVIQEHLAFVHKQKKERISKLRLLPDENKGLELLHLFIMDLLGQNTVAANIFLQKSDEDFKTVKCVSPSRKGLAWAGLVLLNLFFVYYTVLHGYVKGIAWQRAFLIACILQLLMEVLIINTIECIWINFVVPNLVVNEVQDALNALNIAINKVCSVSYTDSRLFLNAPNFLFVSTNLCREFPDLLESIIIQSYHSYLPGELAKKWQYRTNILTSETGFMFRLRNLVVFLSLLLKLLGTTPFLVQKVFIRLTQPVILAGIALALMTLFSSTTNIVVFSVIVFVAIFAYGSRIYLRHRNSAAANSDVKPVDENVVEEEVVDGNESKESESVANARSKVAVELDDYSIGEDSDFEE